MASELFRSDGGAEDPVADLLVVEKELVAYGHDLVERPRLLVLNKQELLDEQHQDQLVDALQAASGRRLILISAAMGLGLEGLLAQVWKELGV